MQTMINFEEDTAKIDSGRLKLKGLRITAYYLGHIYMRNVKIY